MVAESSRSWSEPDEAEDVVQPGRALKPGHMLAEDELSQKTEALSTLRSEDELLANLGLQLRSQHEAVMHALDEQSLTLNDLKHEFKTCLADLPVAVSPKPISRAGSNRSKRSRFGTAQSSLSAGTAESPSANSPTKEVSFQREDSPASVAQESASQASQRGASQRSSGVQKNRRPSFTPQLFSTFTHFDLSLQQQAAAADGEQSRKRFAFSRDGATTKEVEESGLLCRLLYQVVSHIGFEICFAMVVVMNSIYIGVEVQYQRSEGAELPQEFERAAQYTFTVLFTLELLARVGAYGFCRLFCSEDWLWSLLDVIIVVSSLWETTLDIVFSSGDNNNISALKAFRVVRLTKILRTVRLIRIFRFVNALRMLVTSIFHTLKSLFWAMVLIALNVYVFAVLFVQAVVDYQQEEVAPELSDRDKEAMDRYFSSVTDTMLSLFMSIAGGVSWEDVVSPLKSISWIWVGCFLFYVSFTYFAVLNVVTAVFCQSAIESAQNDHVNIVQSILANKEAHKQKVGQLFNQLGAADVTSGITFAMFEEKINSPEVREYFSAMGLDIWDAWTFFKLLDVDGGGEIEVEEFLMGCLRLRGQASAMDIQRIIHEQNWLIRSQGKFHTYMENEMMNLKDAMSAVQRAVRPANSRKPLVKEA
mmetsp:Transcript_47564/g.106820  ORF Transcript_47564/g.106820 Transcript_47564/m.106820 type:complete len:647 (+) Transcript_47564:23-1963(+)